MDTRQSTRFRQIAGRPPATDLRPWELCWHTDGKLYIGVGDTDGHATAVQQISGAGASVAWGDLTGIPAYATRWPAWGEVTAKPYFYAMAFEPDAPNNSLYYARRNNAWYAMGSAAQYNIGTSGGTVPLLSGNNTWSANQTLQGSDNRISGALGVGGANGTTAPYFGACEFRVKGAYSGTNVGDISTIAEFGDARFDAFDRIAIWEETVTAGGPTGGNWSRASWNIGRRVDSTVQPGRIEFSAAHGVRIIGNFGVTGTLSLPGTTSQYVRGDGSLATLPASGDITGVTAGDGLTGGGSSGSVTVSMGTPGSCSPSTSNGTTGTSHTHALTGVSGTPATCTASTSNSNGSTHTHNITGFLPLTGGTLTGTLTGTTIQATTVRQTASDRRLKTDIEPLADQTERIMALQPVRYRLKVNGNEAMGLIAQDVQHYYPQAVGQLGDTDKLALSYEMLIAPLLDVVQRQQRQINALNKRLEALER